MCGGVFSRDVTCAAEFLYLWMVIVDLLTDDETDKEIKALINRDEYVTFMCMQGVDVGDLIKPETSAQQTWWGGAFGLNKLCWKGKRILILECAVLFPHL